VGGGLSTHLQQQLFTQVNEREVNMLDHYLIADGTGEISRKFVRRACDPNTRIHVGDLPLVPPDGGRCSECIAIVEAMLKEQS
jgi:hypothetical protein